MLLVLCLLLLEVWLLLLELELLAFQVCYVGEELLSFLRRLPPLALLVPI